MDESYREREQQDELSVTAAIGRPAPWRLQRAGLSSNDSEAGTTMNEVSEGKRVGQFLIADDGMRSRSTEILAATYVIGIGAVVGRITATGLIGPYAPDSNDGRRKATGIAFDAADASDADTRFVVIDKDATVRASDLSWGTDDATAIAQGMASLGRLGIKFE